jgi:hypothetical protein
VSRLRGSFAFGPRCVPPPHQRGRRVGDAGTRGVARRSHAPDMLVPRASSSAGRLAALAATANVGGQTRVEYLSPSVGDGTSVSRFGDSVADLPERVARIGGGQTLVEYLSPSVGGGTSASRFGDSVADLPERIARIVGGQTLVEYLSPSVGGGTSASRFGDSVADLPERVARMARRDVGTPVA